MKGIRTVVTYKCNIMCSCCRFKCGPHKKGGMDFKSFKNKIENYYEKGYCDYIVIDGGEYFIQSGMVFGYLKSILMLKSKKYIVTNGSWGDFDSFYYTLEDMKCLGLYGVIIEYDYFHSKFISFDTIKNAIKKIKKTDLRVIFKSCFISPDIRRIEDKETFNYIKHINKSFEDVEFIFEEINSQKLSFKRVFSMEEKLIMFKGCDTNSEKRLKCGNDKKSLL